MERKTSRRFLCNLLVPTLLTACGDPTRGEAIDGQALALDVCGETVPENRFVDGIPAYAQCDATMDSSIWSNNGVDTSVTSLGPDWVQTQRSGGYQCTELAYRYMRFRWNVSYRSGDAQEWCDGELPANLVKSTTPVHGDLIVFAGGVCGADATTGHIAVVDTVDDARGTVTIVEENRAGRRSTEQSCATCFLHATANDGSNGVGGGAGAGAGGGTGPGGAGMGGRSPGGSGGAGGVSEPPTGGTAGASGAVSGSAGSMATGGNAGAPSGGAPSGGTLPVAGSGPSSTGGSGTAGAQSAGTPGASGAMSEPMASDGELDSGCSSSGTHGRGRGALAQILGLVLALALAQARQVTRRSR